MKIRREIKEMETRKTVRKKTNKQTEQAWNERVITEKNAHGISKRQQGEPRLQEDSIAEEAVAPQRTGRGLASFALTQSAPVCARLWETQSSTRDGESAVRGQKGAVPCAYKKDSVGIKLREWLRFMVRQKHREGREERIMLTFIWPQTQPTLFCPHSVTTEGENAKGVTLCKAALYFLAARSSLAVPNHQWSLFCFQTKHQRFRTQSTWIK